MKIETPKLLLPRTGQTATSPTANYAVGDDGWFQAGNPRATRFVDHGNGTISDRATGLQWVKDPSQIGGALGTPGTPATMTWADAVANCLGTEYGGSLAYAGFTDWRLPNMIELAGILVENGWYRIPPAMVGVRGDYWSGTTWEKLTTYAYAARADNGSGNTLIAASKTGTYYVRPVRGGRVNNG